jgi:hypothetical protein
VLKKKNSVTNVEFWRIKYYAVLDSINENFTRCFSNQSLELANSVDNFFLFNYNESKLFNNHYKVIIHQQLMKSLNNELFWLPIYFNLCYFTTVKESVLN